MTRADCLLTLEIPLRYAVLPLLLAVVTATGCSFDTAQTAAPCAEEGAEKNGFICVDGHWRVGDASDATGDVMPPDDTDTADTSADSCEPRPEAAYCSERGFPCQIIQVEDPCVGRLTIDCSQYVDFDTSLEHCGECGNLCTPPGEHAEPICDTGSCTYTCKEGWSDANREPEDGCETECQISNGGIETCDGDDNDCDGVVDEPDADDATVYYPDNDGDEFGDSSNPLRRCERPADHATLSGDCDDSDADINPDASELCASDGNDENCDGAVDEGCPCLDGETRDCGTSTGICKEGTQTCDENGQWGPCNDARTPEDEVCDGQDNNCDGTVDELFPTLGNGCEVGVGQCARTGQLECAPDENGVQCDASPGPSQGEICDDLDNDCDGGTDEDFPNKGDTCNVGTGACAATGNFICSTDTTTTVCSETPDQPSQEICGNATDEDCDGELDNGCTCDFTNSDGVCSQGKPQPDGSCGEPDDYQSDETDCDQLDNDCDTVVDEGCECDYDGDSDGVCANGTKDDSGFCQAPSNYDRDEMTCDGEDNDCDGDVDEGCDDDGDGHCDNTMTVVGTPVVCPDSPADTADDCDDGDPYAYEAAAPNESSSGCYRDRDGDGYGSQTAPTGGSAGTDCDDTNPWTNPGADEICDGEDNNCSGSEADTLAISNADNWCSARFGSTDCDAEGAGGSLCCEVPGDGDSSCDFEIICDNVDSNGAPIDEDGDGAANCEDPDCDGLSCGDNEVCVYDSSASTGSCQPI